MRKILSLIAGLGLTFALAANVSAATPGIEVSQEKQGTELVVTVTADGTLGATVLDLEFDTDELYCTVDDIVMPEDTENVMYSCDVSDGVVSIGFVALNAKHVPKGTIATITFAIAEEAQEKAASQFSIGLEQIDVVTLEELKKLTGQEDDENEGGNSGGSGNQGGASNEETSDVVALDKEVISDTVEEIKEKLEQTTGDGNEPIVIVVDMKKEDGQIATEVPVEILEAIQGANVEVVLEMGDYSWTINGKEVDAEDLKAINLEVVLDTEAVEEAIVEAVAKGEATYQISLTHDGDFGFEATLTLNLGKEYSGFKGDLYYFDGSKLVFQSSGEIDENGNASYKFSHASDYVIVIAEIEEDDETTEPEEDDKPSDEGNKNEDDTPVDDEAKAKSPWGIIIGAIAVVVVVAGVGVFVYMKRK